jgi:hypothetical protein
MGGIPVKSLPLHKTDGEWILTEYSDGRLQAKLFGDSEGRKTTYWLWGRLKLMPVPPRRVRCLFCLIGSLCFMALMLVGLIWLALR